MKAGCDITADVDVGVKRHCRRLDSLCNRAARRPVGVTVEACGELRGEHANVEVPEGYGLMKVDTESVSKHYRPFSSKYYAAPTLNCLS